ncbi:unnamed protein product [Closterium sp. NIES-64]|nr:unnamed protein product [Closterium sp. NIES-64]
MKLREKQSGDKVTYLAEPEAGKVARDELRTKFERVPIKELQQQALPMAAAVSTVDVNLLHRRMGHAGHYRIKELIKKNMAAGVKELSSPSTAVEESEEDNDKGEEASDNSTNEAGEEEAEFSDVEESVAESASTGCSDPWRIIDTGDNEKVAVEIEDLLSDGAIVIGREIEGDFVQQGVDDNAAAEKSGAENENQEMGKGKRVKKPNPNFLGQRVLQPEGHKWKEMERTITYLLQRDDEGLLFEGGEESLELVGGAALEAPGFTHLSSLATLSVDMSDQEELDLSSLEHLPAFANLSLCGETELVLEGEDAYPVSFAHIPFLESLEFNYSTPRFDLLFPRGVSCSRLERLLLSCSDKLERLPDDIGKRLPRLRELIICASPDLSELPHHFSSLSCLLKLTISEVNVVSLPERFGRLPVLRELSMQQVLISGLPESFSQLSMLEVLNLVDCRSMAALPARFGSLHALKSLCIANSPKLGLPEDIGGLTDLHTLRVTLNHVQELLPCSFTQLNAARMKALPDDFGSALQQLRQLRVEQAAELRGLPDTLTQLHWLTSLEVHAPKLASLPDGIGALSRLRQLNLAHCTSLTRLPSSLTRLSCLHKLSLGYTPVRSLPCHFAHMSRLKALDLESCKHLESLPDVHPAADAA